LKNIGEYYNSVVSCPDCGCIEKSGFPRCPECGLFHSQVAMEHRDAPLRNQPLPKKMILDPSVYSMTGNAEIPEETFDESDEITEWKGGSSTFSIDDYDDEPVSTINVENLPESEDL
tara:strand:- start:24175 stop:24525 length:351 start_codon:yes stop_codon:yes gene_type:complete